MKSGKTLTELAVELERQQQSKRDFLADTRNIRMGQDGQTLELAQTEQVQTFAALGGKPVATIFQGQATRHAHQQIASRLDIPMRYYERMQSQAPELLANNVNHWFKEKPERRMVRTLDGQARAFLSNRYRPLDNMDLAEIVLPKLTSMDCAIQSCEITPTRMYIKATTERITGEVQKGDIVQAGICVSNSEIGSGSLKVEPLIFRLACLNGMIAADRSMKKYHVGRGNGGGDEGASEYFKDETRQADDKAFWMKVRDTVGASLDQIAFARTVKKLQAAQDNRIEDAAKTVELVSDAFTFSDTEQASVLKHLVNGGDLSQYGLLNAVTRASQDVEDYDRATEFEHFGGQVLELPQDQWKKLVA
jgi:hypothetical protein